MKAIGLLLALFLLLAPNAAEAAARFWVGGTGDCSDTNRWSAASGGAGGASVPGSADTATWDGSSGGGVVTCNGPFTWQSMTWGAFTGTMNFSGDFTLTTQFSGSGTGARTFNAGNGTYVIDSTATSPLSMTTVTNLTFNAQGSTFILRGNTANTRTITIDNVAWNNVTIEANTGRGAITATGPTTITGTFTIGAGTTIEMSSGVDFTVGNLTAVGTTTNPVTLLTNVQDTQVGVVSAGSVLISNGTLRGFAFSGGGSFLASNVYDAGLNTGISITPPSAGGGGAGAPSMGGRYQGLH